MAERVHHILPKIAFGLNCVAPGVGTLVLRPTAAAVMQITFWMVGWFVISRVAMFVILSGVWLWSFYDGVRFLRGAGGVKPE
ncbi:MAG: hypothetical protein ABIH41_06850 [Nanoarchaeota archaeon]